MFIPHLLLITPRRLNSLKLVVSSVARIQTEIPVACTAFFRAFKSQSCSWQFHLFQWCQGFYCVLGFIQCLSYFSIVLIRLRDQWNLWKGLFWAYSFRESPWPSWGEHDSRVSNMHWECSWELACILILQHETEELIENGCVLLKLQNLPPVAQLLQQNQTSESFHPVSSTGEQAFKYMFMEDILIQTTTFKNELSLTIKPIPHLPFDDYLAQTDHLCIGFQIVYSAGILNTGLITNAGLLCHLFSVPPLFFINNFIFFSL